MSIPHRNNAPGFISRFPNNDDEPACCKACGDKPFFVIVPPLVRPGEMLAREHQHREHQHGVREIQSAMLERHARFAGSKVTFTDLT
jgi:hypothetical protein